MDNFFNFDSPFFQKINQLADVFLLGLIWFVFSIPIVTIGASTSALFNVYTKIKSNTDSYIFKDFFNSFKMNIKQGILLFFVLCIPITLCILNINLILNYNIFSYNKFLSNVILVINFAILVELIFMVTYAFFILSYVEMKIKNIITFSFFLCNRHFLHTILFLILSIILYIICLTIPIFFIISVSIYTYLITGFLVKILKKYTTNM